MKFLFLPLMFISIGCSGQQEKNQPVKRDMLKLFIPRLEPKNGKDALTLDNCIVFLPRAFKVVIRGRSDSTCTDLKTLSAYLQTNAAIIRQRKLGVLIDSVTRYEDIISVLDILGEQKINNFEVVNFEEYFTPPKPVPIGPPTDVTKTEFLDDSTYFIVKILDEGYQLTILDKKQTVKRSKEIESFISANKPLINSKKIIIAGKGNGPFETFNAVLEIMRKHEWYSFKLVTLPQNVAD